MKNGKLLQAFFMAVTLALLSLLFTSEPAEGPRRKPALVQQEQGLVATFATGQVVAQEQAESRILKVKQPPRARARTRPARPQPKAPEQPVSNGAAPKQPEPAAASKPHRYPKAKPSSKEPQSEATPEQPQEAPVAIALSNPKENENGLAVDLSSDSSWSSLPASGPAMNGFLLVEVRVGEEVKNKPRRDLTLLLDVSASMGERREIIVPVVEAMRTLRTGDRGVVVAFAEQARAFPGPDSLDILLRSLAKSGPSSTLPLGGGTNMMVGLRSAINEVRNMSQRGRTRELVIVSDGLTRAAGMSPAEHERHCIEACLEADLPVSVIGIGADCNRSFLSAIARKTRGRFSVLSHIEQLPEIMLSEVIGLREVATLDSRLLLTLEDGFRVNHAYLVTPFGADLGRPEMIRNQTVEVPLGDLRKGLTVGVLLEVVYPSRPKQGETPVARARVAYDLPEGGAVKGPPYQLKVHYSDAWDRPERNPAMRDAVADIQKLRRYSTR